MAIVNLTPDSFSNDGRGSRSSLSSNLRLIKKIVADGADIIDLGAESSRPGAKRISDQEEIRRLIPTVSKISQKVSVPISVDTYKPAVAKAALEAGASIINVIEGCKPSLALLKVVKDYDAAIVLMHMRGNPRTMQSKTKYKNVVKDVVSELKSSVQKCLGVGIKKDRIIIDPGIGFSKTPEQNLQILNNLSQFHLLGCPVLVGPSRKSFIGKITAKDTDKRLMGTAAAVAVSVVGGSNIVRVHDVKEIKDVVLVTDSIINQRMENK